jgi:hypothetical protein
VEEAKIGVRTRRGEWKKKEKEKKNRGQGKSWRKWKEEKCVQTEVGRMIS